MDNPQVRALKAEALKNRSNAITLEYTPDRKLIYDPSASNPYSPRQNCPLSVSEWKKTAHKRATQMSSKKTASESYIEGSKKTRSNACRNSQATYQCSTGSLNVRVADTKHGVNALYFSLEVAENAIEEVNEATEAVTMMFESEADALDEILYCKQARSKRPETERIKDEATLAIKNREEELDPANHEVMLTKLDKVRRSLLRLEKKLTHELGTKIVAQDIDQEALDMEPTKDPPEEPAPAPKEVNDHKDMITLPTDKLRLFETFARKQVLRGTGLPCQPQFSQIDKLGMLMDKTEYKSFCKRYSLDKVLDTTKLMTVFHGESNENKGYLTATEFAQCAYEVEKACNDTQKAWAVQKPTVPKSRVHQSTSLWGTAPVRDAALTIKQQKEESEIATPRPQALYETQGLPLSEPVSWKRNMRELLDQTDWHAKEANRLLEKAKKFVVAHSAADNLGRTEIIAALRRKISKTEDFVQKLKDSVGQAECDIREDDEEGQEVDRRREAVQDFLKIAEDRLTKRVERPMEEQARDPAHYALEGEVRQGKAELTKLNLDHDRLCKSIENLQKLVVKLKLEIDDKQKAIDLDSDCVTRLSIQLVHAD